MLILGIDPGTATTGFGLLESNDQKDGNVRFKVIEWGLIETSKDDNPGQRLSEIHKQMNELLERMSPEIMVMEKVFFATNAKTVIRVGQAQGVILLAAANYNVMVEEYSPMTIKKVVAGHGRAKKKEVEIAVKKIFPQLATKDLNNASLQKRKMTKTHVDNAVDALAIALCHVMKPVLALATDEKKSPKKKD